MANKTVYFSVDPGDTEARWIAVDDQDVALVNGRGSTSVDEARVKHALTWWLTGESGTKISVIGSLDEAGDQVVVKVESEIPKDERDGGGRRRFELKPKAKQ